MTVGASLLPNPDGLIGTDILSSRNRRILRGMDSGACTT